jgi:hypothetical protein
MACGSYCTNWCEFVHRADGISEIEGKAARVAASEQGRERVSSSCLFAGSLCCGDDFVEVLITAQRIPARIKKEIAAQISPMSRILFCDQFLKPRIVADRIPDRIES